MEEYSRRGSRRTGAAATWRCNACGESVEEQFDACWKCSSPRGDPDGVTLTPGHAGSSHELENYGSRPAAPGVRPMDRLQVVRGLAVLIGLGLVLWSIPGLSPASRAVILGAAAVLIFRRAILT